MAGGWIMVVMDFIGHEYGPLWRNSKKSETTHNIGKMVMAKVQDTLHGAELVHGDLRDTGMRFSRMGQN
jgi:serine/threonine-protein kinase RIO1